MSDMTANEMLNSIRSSLALRANGINSGGDIVVMALVDEIVEKEVKARAVKRVK